MCKPVISVDNYGESLVLSCEEHNTKQPVLDFEGVQTYEVDVLTHIDMLIDHRAMYDRPKKE